MMDQLFVTLICGICYLTGALAGYLHLRWKVSWAPVVLRLFVLAAVGLGSGYLLNSIVHNGVVQTFQQNFESALLLGTLIGLVGLGTHLSPTMRGLDGLLFLAAGLVHFIELIVLRRPDTPPMSRPWFISHSLAFAVSAAFFIAGGVAGIAYLLVNWMLRRKRLALVRSVPPLESLERFGRWMPIIGFPLFTFGILTGMCGVAHQRKLGETWYLDPTFLFSVAAWGVYAYLVLSLMYRPQIRGRRAAALATYGLGLFVVAYLARSFISPLHQ